MVFLIDIVDRVWISDHTDRFDRGNLVVPDNLAPTYPGRRFFPSSIFCSLRDQLKAIAESGYFFDDVDCHSRGYWRDPRKHWTTWGQGKFLARNLAPRNDHPNRRVFIIVKPKCFEPTGYFNGLIAENILRHTEVVHL